MLELLTLLAVVVLAAVLRAYHLGTKSLWLDEINYARSSYGDGTLLGAFGAAINANPPGYPFLIRLLLHLGRGEWLLRLPALLASVGGVVAIWLLGRSLFGPAEGLLAAFLLAISRIHVQYAQEVHSYALFATLSILMLWALYRAAHWSPETTPDGRSWRQKLGVWSRAWWPFILFAVLNLYTNYYALVPVALSVLAFPCFLLARRGGSTESLWRNPIRQRGLGHLLIALAVVTLLALPLFLLNLGGSARPVGLDLTALETGQDSSRFGLSLDLLYKSFLAFAVWRGRWTGVALAVGFAWLFWPGEMKRRQRWAIGLALLFWLVVSVPAVAWLANRLGFNFAPRRALFIGPVLVLVMAVGILAVARWIAWLWRRVSRGRGNWSTPITVVAVGLLVLVFSLGNIRFLSEYYHTPKQDWKTLAAILESLPQPNEAVVLLPDVATNLSWYYENNGSVVEVFPARKGATAAEERLTAGDQASFFRPEELIENLTALCRARDAVFVATAATGRPLDEADRAWLAEHFIEVPLQLLQLYYRNCRPDAWYGDGALPLFEMAYHPEMPLLATQQAWETYQQLAKLRPASTLPLTAQGKPKADRITAASTATPPPSTPTPSFTVTPTALATVTPTPAATPTPIPALDEDLDIWLAGQVESRPEDPATHLHLAAYLATQQNFNGAATHFDQALELDPGNWLAYALKAQTLRNAGQQAEALAVVEQGLAVLPQHPALTLLAARLRGDVVAADDTDAEWRATLDAGKAALRDHGWEAAIAAGQAAVEQAPQTHETYLLLGDAYRAAGQLEEAAAAYQEAIYRAPGFGFLHARLGEVLARLERPEEALEAGLTAVALDETRWESWLALGRAYAALAATDAQAAPLAESALRRSLALAPADSPAPRLALADFLVAQQRPADAVAVYEELAAQRPDDRAVQRRWADLLRAAGRLDEALAAYQTLTETHPTDRETRMALAATLADLGRTAEALAAYQAISAAWPNFPWAHVRRGELLEQEGDLPAAIKAYQAAVAVAPDNASVHFVLAYAYRRAGQREQAIAEFEAGLALDPGREAARVALEELKSE